MPLQHPDQQFRHMRPPKTHINPQTRIISNGTISNSQPQWNQGHIRTSVSPVQDEMASKNDTGSFPCIPFHIWIVSLNEGGAMAYETVQIEKTGNVCSLCKDYAKRQASKPVVVMSCKGGCLRGEVARRAANLLTFGLHLRRQPVSAWAEPSRRTRGNARWREPQAGSWQLKAALLSVPRE
jgi:hypothetical protein